MALAALGEPSPQDVHLWRVHAGFALLNLVVLAWFLRHSMRAATSLRISVCAGVAANVLYHVFVGTLCTLLAEAVHDCCERWRAQAVHQIIFTLICLRSVASHLIKDETDAAGRRTKLALVNGTAGTNAVLLLYLCVHGESIKVFQMLVLANAFSAIFMNAFVYSATRSALVSA